MKKGGRSQKKWGEDKLVNEQVRNGYTGWLRVRRRWIDTSSSWAGERRLIGAGIEWMEKPDAELVV